MAIEASTPMMATVIISSIRLKPHEVRDGRCRLDRFMPRFLHSSCCQLTRCGLPTARVRGW